MGYKLMLANGVAELSEAVGADCDDVMGTLRLATDRLVSDRYMKPGMGDGGGCHPAGSDRAVVAREGMRPVLRPVREDHPGA